MDRYACTFSGAKNVWNNLPVNANGFCCHVKCLNVLLCFCMEFLVSLKSLFPLLSVKSFKLENNVLRSAGYKLTV